MSEQVSVTIDSWTFEYNPDLSGNVFIGGEFEIPMEVLLKFFMDLPFMQPPDTISRIIKPLPDDDPFNKRITTTLSTLDCPFEVRVKEK